jgi:hypothetical protein
MEVIQVCNEAICDNERCQELIGGKAMWFCCKKGFEQSLVDFAKHIANSYKCHVCRDTGVFKWQSCPNC